MSVVTVVPAGTRTVSGSQSFNGWSPDLPLHVQTQVSSVNGTSPSLTVAIEVSLDGGSTWTSIGQSMAISGIGVARRTYLNDSAFSFSDLLRVSWVISGTSPSFDFSVIVHAKP